MPVIEAGAGVRIDLPDQPTSLARLEPTLTEAWRDYSTRTLIADPDPAAALWRAGINWWDLLYRLWREDKIEPWGRRGAPDAELAPINFPVSERERGRWHTRMPVAEMRHDASGVVFFDAHLRAVATAGTAAAPPQASLGDAARRSRMIHSIWATVGYPPWTWRQAWEQARAAYPGSPLFAECSSSLKKHVWTAARKLRR